MADIILTRGDVGIDGVSYSWVGTPPADYTSGLDEIEFRISKVSVQGPHEQDSFYGVSFGEGTLKYERTGTGTTTYTITASMTCQTRTYVYDWEYTDWENTGVGTTDWITNQYTINQIIYNSVWEQHIISNVEERTDDYGGKQFKYTYNIFTRGWEDTSYYTNWHDYQTYSDSFIFYPHPKVFTFNNCSTGNKWQVDKGIDSLITNIEVFSSQATQWKSWKNQSAASACPLFFPAGSGSRLTAVRLNAVYNYIFGTQPWSVGDTVSAAMFNDLAEKINEL